MRRNKHFSVSIFLSGVFLLTVSVGFGFSEEKTTKADASERTRLLKTFQSEFVSITPGKGKFPASFQMGTEKGNRDESPVRSITLKAEFAIAKYEVTQELYQVVMRENPSVWGGPRNSVEMVTWIQAVQFCQKVTSQMRADGLLTDQQEIRLPTESEWEYCCRAGTKTEFSFGASATKTGDMGNSASVLNSYGWHTGNAAGNDPPVGALKPNPWGLYDMHGYLWEYVQDSYGDYKTAPNDGRPAKVRQNSKEKGQNVVRGGSWRDNHKDLRSASRRALKAGSKSDAIGFRCVRAAIAAKNQ